MGCHLEIVPGHDAIRQSFVRACHDLSEGGLAAAIAEMAFAGGLGVSLDLQPLAKSSGLADDSVLLFSKSNSRFVLEVPAASQASVESLCRSANVPIVKLGEVTANSRVQVRGVIGAVVIDSDLDELKQCWKQPLAWG